ncbi:signal protein PDZ [Citricoccus nitrophenolicus]
MSETGHPPSSPSAVPGSATPYAGQAPAEAPNLRDATDLKTWTRRTHAGRRRRRITAVAGAVAGLLTLTAVALPSPFIIESPGPTFNTIGEFEGEPVITVAGAETYPTDGNLDLTTVYVSGAPTGWTTFLDVMRSWVNPTASVIPQELVYPSGTTSEEVNVENSEAMATSQSWAVAAALENLGIDYRQTLFVAGFTEDSQATDLLQPEDQLVTADGIEVTGLEGLKNRLNDSGGEPVDLGIVRDGQQRTVEVPVYEGPQGEWLMGVFLDSDFEFPLDVAITLENVGGPSAGLMFALGIVDELTPGAMAGGQHLAGTGTIDPDGTVGEIGGIVQKVAGAQAGGARHFLAPAGNCAELAGNVPEGIEVYSVTTLEQARTVVETVGSGETPQAPTCG